MKKKEKEFQVFWKGNILEAQLILLPKGIMIDSFQKGHRLWEVSPWEGITQCKK
jgi:hypothetical protein